MSLLTAEDQQLLVDSIDRYFADNYGFDARQSIVASELGYSVEHWRNLAELGALGLPFSESMGGFGGAIADALPLAKTMGKHLAVEPFIGTVVLAGRAIAEGNNQPLQETILPGIIAGETLAALAFDEKGARGNPCCISATVTHENDGYRIKGEKIAVMGALHSRYLVVSARRAGALTDTQGIDLLLVDSEAEGVTMTGFTSVDGHRAANVVFDTQVSSDRRLTAAGEAYPVLQRTINDAILVSSAEALGVMEALIDVSAEYLSTRQQFRAPLASFQVLRHKMADMMIAFKGAQCLFEALLSERASDGDLPTERLSVLKAKVGSAGRMIGSAAVQLHGGIGTTDELNVGHYMKRLTALNLHFGGVDLHLKKVWRDIHEKQGVA